MAKPQSSVFRAAALASGLVTSERLDEAVAMLRITTQGGVRIDADDISDDTLATKLIELELLNPWQVEQLRAGRSKFNLGEYRIIDSIGQGGMGQVFKAVHTLLGRVEAIKVLPRSKSTPEAVESFLREIRAQAQLDHPNLVRVSYAGCDGNVYFLVTEFVPGTDLRKLVRSGGALGASQAASIISQAAQALAYAHRRGLIHRDVKPGNILVTPEGVAKVSDLGLAAFHEEKSERDPRAGKVVGTADYLSPEQILAPSTVGPPSDIYGLGCTFYYAVTGKVPYPGGTSKEKARRHCHDSPLHPRRANPELSESLVEIIAEMMEKDPADRIQTGEEVVGRLAPWVSGSVPMPPRMPASSPSSAEDEAAQMDDTDPGFPEILVSQDSSEVAEGTDALMSPTEETEPDPDSIPSAPPRSPELPRVASPSDSEALIDPEALPEIRPAAALPATPRPAPARSAPTDAKEPLTDNAEGQTKRRVTLPKLPKFRVPRVRLPKFRVPRVRLPKPRVSRLLMVMVPTTLVIAGLLIWLLFHLFY